MKPVEIEYLIKNGTKATLEKISADLLKVGSDGSQSSDAISAAFVRSGAQVTLLRDVITTLESKLLELKNVNPELDQTVNIAEAEKLKTKIEELKTQLVQLEQTNENTQILPPSLPNAKKQFDGLHFSIQQMAREMPSLAMGPQMFFLAISNNLPIFTDELARAKKEYAALTASGEKGTPVWKQVTKSLFSWQTAMTTGIMLLVMFGDKITSAIGGMFGLNTAITETSEAAKQAAEDVEKEQGKIEALTSIVNNSNVAYEKRLSALNELKSLVPGYNASLTTEGDLIDNNTAAIERYLGAFREKIYLQAAEDDLTQAYINRRQAEQEIEDKIAKGSTVYAGGSLSAGNMSYTTVQYSDAEADKMRKDYLKSYDDQIEKLNNEIAERSNKIESSDSPIYGDMYDNAKKQWDQTKATLSQIEADRYSFTQKQYEDALNAEKIARESFDKLGGKVSNNHSASDNTEKQYQNDRLASLKEAADAELEIERSKITDKIKLIEFERDSQIKAIEAEKLAYQQQYKDGDTSGFDRQIAAVGQKSEADIDAQNKASLKAEIAAHQQYLQDYGTFQQQKYAIAQEYAEKLKKAQTEGERLSLEKELASFNSKIETETLKMNIDWATVFGGFGGIFSDLITPALEDAKKYLSTDDFKNADEASKQALIDAINQMEQSLGGSDSLNFKKLGVDMQYYQDSLIALNDAKQEEIELIGKLAEAQKTYNEALESGSKSEIDAAETTLTTAQENADAASTNVQTLTATATQAQTTVNNTATKLSTNMDNVTQGLSQIASGSLNGAYNGLIQMSKGIGGAMGGFADKLENLPIIGWIASILDIFKDGISVVVGGLLDAVFSAVAGIVDDLLSGDLFITIGESILSGISHIFDALTWGGFSSWVGNGDSDKTLKEDVGKLTLANENLERALNNLTEVMEDAAVKDAGGIYEQQKSNIEAQIANTQEMMRRYGAAYSNGFLGIGGDHSSNYEIDRGLSEADWNRISSVVGRNIGSAGDFWGLSSEEMAKVADQATDLYTRIQDLADDGHENAAQYMDEYIEYYKQLEELEEALAEKRTNTTFESVRDKFKSTLKDMGSDAANFKTDLDEMFQDAIIEALMTEHFDDRLKDWYKQWASYMEDGDMSSDENSILSDLYNDIVNDALNQRENLSNLFGWDNSSSTTQSARSGAFETMTQDQGTKLEGLFTSSEMRIARIETGVESVASQMSTAVGHLERIEANTGKSATSLKSLVERIEQIIRDGLKIK